MYISIIGSGGAGLVSAWLLQHNHSIEIFERDSIPGGNVRTLNRNVRGTSLDPHVNIENGVLGFHRESYPNFFKLMDKLNVQLRNAQPYARLYENHCVYPETMKALWDKVTLGSIGRRAKQSVRMIGMLAAHKQFVANLKAGSSFADVPSLLTKNNTLRTLQKSVLMLSFSTPYEAVEKLPVELVQKYFLALTHPDWSYVDGGVFRYMEVILNSFKGKLHLNADVKSVIRNPNGVELVFQNGERRTFDKVIFAIPPGNILSLLADPSDAERVAFSPWKNREFVTLAHTDDQMYKGFDAVSRTPMDLFADGQEAGYNTSMNKPYGYPLHTPYSFAYNMEKYIRPEQILNKQAHIVPVHTQESWNTRERIGALQGEKHCYYAGAWLGNALHEGAVSSAVEAGRKFGVNW